VHPRWKSAETKQGLGHPFVLIRHRRNGSGRQAGQQDFSQQPEANPDGLQSQSKSILGNLNAGRCDLWVQAPLRGLTNLSQRGRDSSRFPRVEQRQSRSLPFNLAKLIVR